MRGGVWTASGTSASYAVHLVGSEVMSVVANAALKTVHRDRVCPSSTGGAVETVKGRPECFSWDNGLQKERQRRL